MLYDEEEQLRYAGFLEQLQDNKIFRTFFIELLSQISFRAYQWETPPVSSSSIDQLFEFIVTRTPGNI